MVDANFKLVLAEYGIAFKKAKPSTNNAKEVEATVIREYQPE